MATTNQLEYSRVSAGTARKDRTQPEISNMIAEGAPVAPDGNIPTRVRRRGLAAASTLLGHPVLKARGVEVGHIEEIMLDLKSGQIAWAVLSFSGFPGNGNKRFPVPWDALQIDPGERNFVLDVDRKTLEGAPEFDEHNWPDMADPAFGRFVHDYYDATPYWQEFYR